MPMNLFGFKKQIIMETIPDHEVLPSVLPKLNGLLIIHLNSIWTKLDEDVGKTFYIFNNNLHFSKFRSVGNFKSP